MKIAPRDLTKEICANIALTQLTQWLGKQGYRQQDGHHYLWINHGKNDHIYVPDDTEHCDYGGSVKAIILHVADILGIHEITTKCQNPNAALRFSADSHTLVIDVCL